METTRVPGSGSSPNPARRAGRFGAALMALSLLLAAAGPAFAQNEKIVSTRLGEVPTTGGQRPGPIGVEPTVPEPAAGVLPVSIAIDKIGVNAQIETIEIVDGVMQDPTGPWVVSWYKETARIGETGNAVMSCHLDYWDVGPAVCYNIGTLAQGDPITVTGEDGETYTYEVDWVEQYESANAPIQDIVGPTEEESLTLITCGGPFDYENGVYLQRTVVRSHRVTG